MPSNAMEYSDRLANKSIPANTQSRRPGFTPPRRLHHLCSEDIKVFETVTSLVHGEDTVSIKDHELG